MAPLVLNGGVRQRLDFVSILMAMQPVSPDDITQKPHVDFTQLGGGNWSLRYTIGQRQSYMEQQILASAFGPCSIALCTKLPSTAKLGLSPLISVDFSEPNYLLSCNNKNSPND